MVLCGRSPRHLYVANTLCQAAEVVAIVQETGSAFTWKKLFKTLRPDNLTRKVWRWLRDRRRYTGNREGQFFFGEQAPHLAHPELVREVDFIAVHILRGIHSATHDGHDVACPGLHLEV